MIKHLIECPAKPYIYTPYNFTVSPFTLQFSIPYTVLKNIINGTLGHEVGHLVKMKNSFSNTYEAEMASDNYGAHNAATTIGQINKCKFMHLIHQYNTIYDGIMYLPIACSNLALTLTQEALLEMANVYFPQISNLLPTLKSEFIFHEKIVNPLYNYHLLALTYNIHTIHPSYKSRIDNLKEILKKFPKQEIDDSSQEKITVSIYKRLTGQLLKEEEL